MFIIKHKKVFILFLLSLLMIFSLVVYPNAYAKFENFTSLSPSITPQTSDKNVEADLLLADTFPITGRDDVSSNNYNDIWWHYPIFKVGSYAQITNNLKYVRNPDDGKCINASFCGALYKNIKNESNYSVPLPPAPDVTNENTRVNYYVADQNLFLGNQGGPGLQTLTP